MSFSSWSKSSSSSVVSAHDAGAVGELRHSIRHTLKKLLPRQLRARRRARESKHLYRRVYTRHKTLTKTLQKKRKRPAQGSNGDRPPRVETLSTEVFDLLVEFREHLSTLNLLSRIAETRMMLARIQGAHGDLDSLFQDAELTRTREMTEWQDCWHQDLTQYVSNVRTLLTTTHHHYGGNSNVDVSEMNRVLTNISYEITHKRAENGTEVVALLEWVLERMTHQRNVAIPFVYSWYIPPYDVEWKQELFDMGSRSTLHLGTFERSTKVVVKRLFESHGQQQLTDAFVSEAEIWTSLRHPHVLKLHGACHLATPPFFVCESAGERRNFVDYFSENCPDRRMQLWRLLYEAALGIQYLHQKNIMHGGIKCRNLLVGADSKARVCGFGWTVFVTDDQRSSRQETSVKNVRWTSREVLIDSAPPSSASDLFSFGMAIIEAVSGDIPWRSLSDDEVICSVRDRMQHDRPEGFTDKQWRFVQALCGYNPLTRMTMGDAIEALEDFVRERDAGEPESEAVSTALGVPEDSVELERIPSWLETDSEYKALFSVLVPRLEELQNALTSEKQTTITREQLHTASSKYNSIVRRFQDPDASMMQSSERISNVLEVMGLICTVKIEIDDLATLVDLPTHHDWGSRWPSEWNAKNEQLLSEHESRLGKLCPEMRENESAARFLISCLGEILLRLLTPEMLRIRLEVAAAAASFDSICTQLVAFMEKHSVRKNILYRIASSRWVVTELQRLQQKVFELARIVTVAGETITEWEQRWRELIMIRASSLEIQLDQQNNMRDLLPDRSSQEEALVLLKFELEKPSDANPQKTDPSTNLVEKALVKATAALKLDVQSVPDWFIPSYELAYDDSCLGQGSFGSAHLGSWKSSQRVVVKILPVGGLGSARANATFMDEVRKWESLDHHHILKLHGASHVGSRAFLVLDYADHGNLLQYLDIPENRPKIAQLFHQAAHGLAYLHSQEIVHGHLRCCNILVSIQDEEVVVKLSDFGFGSVRSAVNAVGGSNVTNSIQWMAPEHFEMEEAGPSYAADVFSLGMCMVEALVRGPPWGEMDEMDVLDNILDEKIPPTPSDAPSDVWDLVVHILQDRPGLDEVTTRLEELATSENKQKM